jgi:hypothetical protein
MVGQKMPFLNATLLLLGQLSEYLAQMLAQGFRTTPCVDIPE